MIEINQRVTVADKQLHGNHSLLLDGQVISMAGNGVVVQLDGEEFPREFSLDQLKSSTDVYGAEQTDKYHNQVIDGIRHR